jgi:threonylcarbamoyladenosine tRNA methylthiotransferase MtaB
VVTGCAATNWIKTNSKVDGVDYLIDNKNKDFVSDLLEKRYTNKKQNMENQYLKNIDLPTTTLPTDKFMRSRRVVIKIQDGCHRFCTYCIVPYLRGLPKSRKISDIVTEINSFDGFQEAVLTAINTEAFGRDTGENFIELINQILKNTYISRISFGSIHPWTLDDEFLNFYKTVANSFRFADFFHIPLQSGSDKMLGLMKRGYTRDEIMSKLNSIKEINNLALIGTDIIVGFLEETDSDFEDTYNFLEKSPIAKFHVFRYSKRQHTASYYLGKRLQEPSDSQKKARSKKLRDLSEAKYNEFQNKHIDRVFDALVLENKENEYQQAVLSNNMIAMVKVNKDFTGEKKRVKILDCCNDVLIGNVIS